MSDAALLDVLTHTRALAGAVRVCLPEDDPHNPPAAGTGRQATSAGGT